MSRAPTRRLSSHGRPRRRVLRRAGWAIAVLVALLTALPALAQEVRLQLDVDQLAEGQRTGFDVIVQGARPRGLPDVRSDQGVTTAFVGQSRTTSIINGRMTEYTRFRFEVVGQQQGAWTLGPAYVVVDEGGGKTRTLRTESASIVIGPASDRTVTDGWIEIDHGFDVGEAWQGQVVVYHTALRTRRSLASAGWYGQPDEGLLVPKDARPEQREYVVQDARGSVLVQETWQPYVVTSSGELSWPAPAVEVDVYESGGFGLFRRSSREVVAGTPMTLKVRPLPPAPPGFSGLVGDFRLDTRLEKDRVKVGESIDWSLMVDGTGSLEGFQLPAVPDVDGLRIYEGSMRPRATVRRGSYRAGMTFERTLVPTKEGTLELPPVELIVFSPSRGAYVTVRAPGATLRVRPGEAGQLEVQSFAPDAEIAPDALVADDGGVRPLRARGPAVQLPWLTWLPLALALAATPALGVGVLTVGELLARRRREQVLERAQPATPVERLRHLPDDPEARLTALDDALRLALSQRAGVPLAELDRAVAAEQLGPALGAEVAAVSNLLDRVRFAAAPAPPDLEPRVRALVATLAEEAA